MFTGENCVDEDEGNWRELCFLPSVPVLRSLTNYEANWKEIAVVV